MHTRYGKTLQFFDPQQKRDKNGKWTKTGGGGAKATTAKPFPEVDATTKFGPVERVTLDGGHIIVDKDYYKDAYAVHEVDLTPVHPSAVLAVNDGDVADKAAAKHPPTIPKAEPELYKQVDTKIQRILVQAAVDEKMDPTDAGQKLLSMIESTVKSSRVAMRVPPSIVEKILDEGIKNQHQTGSSQGLFNPKSRKEAEFNMFGLLDDTPAEDYPVYGYLEQCDPELKNYSVVGYGDARITFKDSIKKRTTFTVGDSLFQARDRSVMPAPIEEPHLLTIDGNAEILLHVVKGKTPRITNPSNAVGYFEAQIHGKVTVDDIARIDFGTYAYVDDEVKQRLKAMKIPVGVLK